MGVTIVIITALLFCVFDPRYRMLIGDHGDIAHQMQQQELALKLCRIYF